MSWNHLTQGDDPIPFAKARWAQGLTQRERLVWPEFAQERYPALSLDEAARRHAATPEPPTTYGAPLWDVWVWKIAQKIVAALAVETVPIPQEHGENIVDVYRDNAIVATHRYSTPEAAIAYAQSQMSSVPAFVPEGVSRFADGEMTIRIEIVTRPGGLA